MSTLRRTLTALYGGRHRIRITCPCDAAMDATSDPRTIAELEAMFREVHEGHTTAGWPNGLPTPSIES